MGDKSKEMLSTSEVARILGLSRMQVIRKIKKGEIVAERVGRSYVIKRSQLRGIYRSISSVEKKKVEKAVDKVLHEYGDVIRRLGRE